MPSNNNSIQNISFIFDKISRQINFTRRNVDDCVCITLVYVINSTCDVELKALYSIKQLRDDVWHYSEIRYLDGGRGKNWMTNTAIGSQPVCSKTVSSSHYIILSCHAFKQLYIFFWIGISLSRVFFKLFIKFIVCESYGYNIIWNLELFQTKINKLWGK